jgi:hypothetical protein
MRERISRGAFMARAAFTETDILDQLDRHAQSFNFPTLDNGYIYPVDARLTAYRDDRRWAIVIEHIGFMYKSCLFGNILYTFGNCLTGRRPGHGPIVSLADGSDDNWAEDGMIVRRDIHSVPLRGRVLTLSEADLALPVNPAGERGRELTIPDLFRRLLPRCRDPYRATEAELRGVVPADLPQILRLEEWEHSDAVHDVLPSHTECFPMLAKVLVAGDASHYKPTKPPNTHWSNWPAGGTL